MSYPIVIVGGGLSGLYASSLLAQSVKSNILLVEARDRLGGRIMSKGLKGQQHRVDLGPSWFWPGMNPLMKNLVVNLGIPSYPQHTKGFYLTEMSDGNVHRRYNAWPQSPESYRLAGGMQTLVDKLTDEISEKVDVKLGTRVLKMTALPGEAIELTFSDNDGEWTQRASHVILTTPPRLTADIEMSPAWPENMVQEMLETPTWMAGQAKFTAIYSTPFWRNDGLSGDAMSHRGPAVEIHDASDAEGGLGALFGFIGASPQYRESIGRVELERLSLAQLVRIFGEEASTPLQIDLQDWAQETLTSTNKDKVPLSHHPFYSEQALPKEWHRILFLAGTERSMSHGGYLEGALDSSQKVVNDLLMVINGKVDMI